MSGGVDLSPGTTCRLAPVAWHLSLVPFSVREERGSGGAEERRSGGGEERRSGGAEARRRGGAEERRSGGAEERRSGGAEEWACLRRWKALDDFCPLYGTVGKLSTISVLCGQTD